MKKKCFVSVGLFVSVLMLTSCAGQIPDMTDEERKAISEYAAELLLEYDSGHSGRLVDLEELEEATPESEKTSAPEETPLPEMTAVPENTPMPEITPMPEQTPKPEMTPEPVLWDSVEETLLLPDGVTLHLMNYETLDFYEEDSIGKQTLEAEAGKKLLLFRFTMTNNSEDEKKIDMLQDNILYKVFVGEESVNGMITMLEHDLTTYMEIIAARETVELMLFAEVEEEALQTAATIFIEFYCGEKQAQVIAK